MILINDNNSLNGKNFGVEYADIINYIGEQRTHTRIELE